MALARPIVGGLVLAGITIGVALLLPEMLAFAGLSVLLGLIAGVYVGFGVAKGEADAILIESGAAAAFLIVATLAVTGDADPSLLALGYVGHGLWDLAHHPGSIDTGARPWYAIACAAYDVGVGAFVFFRFA